MNVRRQQINDYIQRKHEVFLSELKDLVPDVSEMTIRRDLEALEQEGSIIRIHGGAKSVKSINRLVEDVFSKRLSLNTEKKREIGEKAAEMIKEHTSIYLDSGSTTMALAERLPNKRLLISTSGINIALELLRLDQTTLNLIGGEASRNSISVSGPQALACIERLNIDQAFIASTAFSVESGFSCGGVNDCELKRMVLKKAKQKILLMDSTKIGLSMPYTFAHADEIDVLVCDSAFPKEMREYFTSLGVKVV